MDAVFHELVAGALDEVRRREPDYLARFPLAFPSVSEQAERYRQHPRFARYPAAEIEEALAAGIAHFAGQGASVREAGSGVADPLAELMLDSVVDAAAAERRDLRLDPRMPQSGQPLGEILADGYDERRTPAGTRYFIRRRGDRPLVLVNACGIPLAVWSKFLGDRSHGLRIVVVESRTADIVDGGMRAYTDLTVDADDIAAALDHASVDQADILGWCSGGKLAIELANRRPERIRSLVLLSITLRGIRGVERQPNAFEDNMGQIFSTVSQRPTMARIFAKSFQQQEKAQFVDWASLADDPARRAATLFGMPAKEHASALIAPMLQPEFLANYGRRMTFDEAYPIDEVLSRLNLPVLAISGDHDTVVDNALTCKGLRRWGPPAVHARVKGSGHYVHDLQYPYFRSILTDFLAGREPVGSARVEVERLER